MIGAWLEEIVLKILLAEYQATIWLQIHLITDRLQLSIRFQAPESTRYYSRIQKRLSQMSYNYQNLQVEALSQ